MNTTSIDKAREARANKVDDATAVTTLKTEEKVSLIVPDSEIEALKIRAKESYEALKAAAGDSAFSSSHTEWIGSVVARNEQNSKRLEKERAHNNASVTKQYRLKK